MTRRVPIVSTIVVLLAVAAMIALGIWQLHRLQWKEGLLARYHQAQAMSADVPFPRGAEQVEAALYRHSAIMCARVLSTSAMAGRNANDQPGWAHVARCALAGGGEADVVLGWSNQPNPVSWSGGQATGVIGPGRAGEARLIAAPPLAGLAANETPDPHSIPNNHLSYAIQWFLFATTAVVIYVLALRKRWRGKASA
jgi:surfeit locus 1 family protein